MAVRHEIIPVRLADGVTMHIEATMLGEEEVAFNLLSFKDVTDTLASIAEAITGVMQKVKPKKAGVEFGLEIGVESGKLTALLVQGSSKANLKITLEWGE
jgi:Trypsin-co-occurring domain 1